MANGVAEGQTALDQIKGWINQYSGNAQQPSDAAFQALMNFLNGQGAFANPLLGLGGTEDLLSNLQQFRGGVNGLFSNFQMPQPMQDLYNRNSGMMDTLASVYGQQGVTPQSQQLRERFAQIMNGQTDEMTAPSQAAINMLGSGGYTGNMTDLFQKSQWLTQGGGFTGDMMEAQKIANALLSTGGQTPDTRAAINSFGNIINQGGQTAQTGQMFGQGSQMLANGGFTPQMQGLMQQIMQGMQAGGMTPQAKQLFDKMMTIVNNNGQGGALLPMDQMISMARDQAAMATSQQAEAARRQAQQRMGSAAFSGTVQDALNEFSDQSAQNEAGAMRTAAQTQQQLQLQQLLGAAGVGGDLTKAATALMGQYAGVGADLTKTGAANMATGADLQKAAEQIALQRLGIGQTGYNQTLNTELARMNSGSDLLNAVNTLALNRMNSGLTQGAGIETMAGANRNNASNILNTITGLQNQAGAGLNSILGVESGNALGALQGLISTGAQNANIYDTSFKNYLGGTTAQWDAFLKSIGISSDISKNFNTDYLSGVNALNQNAQNWTSTLPSLFGGYSNTAGAQIQAAMQPGFWTKFLSSLAGGVGQSIGGGLGGLLGGIGDTLGNKGGIKDVGPTVGNP